jgi:hypothetical protein
LLYRLARNESPKQTTQFIEPGVKAADQAAIINQRMQGFDSFVKRPSGHCPRTDTGILKTTLTGIV